MIDPKLLKLNFTPQNLTTEQKFKLDNQGFMILPNIINSAWQQELRQACENIMSSEGEHAGQFIEKMSSAAWCLGSVAVGAANRPKRSSKTGNRKTAFSLKLPHIGCLDI